MPVYKAFELVLRECSDHTYSGSSKSRMFHKETTLPSGAATAAVDTRIFRGAVTLSELT